MSFSVTNVEALLLRAWEFIQVAFTTPVKEMTGLQLATVLGIVFIAIYFNPFKMLRMLECKFQAFVKALKKSFLPAMRAVRKKISAAAESVLGVVLILYAKVKTEA